MKYDYPEGQVCYEIEPINIPTMDLSVKNPYQPVLDLLAEYVDEEPPVCFNDRYVTLRNMFVDIRAAERSKLISSLKLTDEQKKLLGV